MDDDAGGALKAVLRLAEEMGVDVIGFGTQREASVNAVIDAATRGDLERIFAVARGLRQQVTAAEQGVAPRFPTSTARAHVDAAGVAKIFDVFIVVNGGRKTGSNVAFEAKPIIGEIRDGSVEADHAGAEHVGLESQKLDAKGQLPAVVISIAKENARRGSGNSRGWSRGQRTGRSGIGKTARGDGGTGERRVK